MNLYYLKDKYKHYLLQLLQKNEEILDGTLGNYKGSNNTIELKGDTNNTKPYHTKPFPIPKIHDST